MVTKVWMSCSFLAVVIVVSDQDARKQQSFCSSTEVEEVSFHPVQNSPRVVSWDEADSICKERNMTLPIISSPCVQWKFSEFLWSENLVMDDIWLGARKNRTGTNDWTWLNGSRYLVSVVNNGSGNCTPHHGVVERLSDVTWTTRAKCSTEFYSFICEYENQSKCLCSVENKKNCYVFYDYLLSWYEARNFCLRNGGDLASIDGTDLVKLNNSFCSSSPASNSNIFWVGLRQSVWKWSTTTSVGNEMEVKTTFFLYLDVDVSGVDCLYARRDQHWLWQTRPCNSTGHLEYFVCQKREIQPSFNTPEPCILSKCGQVPCFDEWHFATIGLIGGVVLLLSIVLLLTLYIRKSKTLQTTSETTKTNSEHEMAAVFEETEKVERRLSVAIEKKDASEKCDEVFSIAFPQGSPPRKERDRFTLPLPREDLQHREPYLEQISSISSPGYENIPEDGGNWSPNNKVKIELFEVGVKPRGWAIKEKTTIKFQKDRDGYLVPSDAGLVSLGIYENANDDVFVATAYRPKYEAKLDGSTFRQKIEKFRKKQLFWRSKEYTPNVDTNLTKQVPNTFINPDRNSTEYEHCEQRVRKKSSHTYMEIVRESTHYEGLNKPENKVDAKCAAKRESIATKKWSESANAIGY